MIANFVPVLQRKYNTFKKHMKRAAKLLKDAYAAYGEVYLGAENRLTEECIDFQTVKYPKHEDQFLRRLGQHRPLTAS